MSARNDTLALQKRLNDAGVPADFDQANELRRAQLTLHRWAELECGDGDDYKSWSIERDEKTDKPFMCIYPHNGKATRYQIADKERGALVRVRRLCAYLKADFYHQTDPRGCALYVSKEQLTPENYTRGIACCV